MSLRQQKSARLKIQLLEVLKDKLQRTRFEDLKVVDICKEVSISKVTFFKYFDSKEELLRFYHRAWCLRASSTIMKQELKGLPAFSFILESLVADIRRNPSAFYSYYSYLITSDRVKAPFTIKSIERELILDGPGTGIEIKSLRQMIETSLLEAVFQKEIEHADPSRLSRITYNYLIGSLLVSAMERSVPNFVDLNQEILDIINKI